MRCSIKGLGTALPPDSVTQQEALALSQDVICDDRRQARWMQTLFLHSGVERRHTVIPWKTGYAWSREHAETGRGPGTAARMQLYARHAPPLALHACQAALENAAVDSKQITHLVLVTCTGFSAPGMDAFLLEQLPLAASVQRVHVGYMGCHGAVNGLRAAQGLAATDPSAKVLLCAVELCSLHYCMKWDDEAIVGNALFADGAAAAVLQAGGPGDESGPSGPTLRSTGSRYLPRTGEQMSWTVGDFGFEMRLSSEIPNTILSHLAGAIDTWLAEHGLRRGDIARWLVHPGGPRILDAVEQALQLAPEQLRYSREVLRKCGNMSSPTVLFILEQSLQDTESPAGPAVMLGFGPGLMIEMALLENS